MVKAFQHSLFIVSLFVVTSVLSNSAYALTKVTASVDRNPAMVNESLVLTVIADDSISADAFDPSVLKTDFVVGSTSVSSQTSMVNMDMTRTTRWTTLLIPKQQGNATIPALTIAGQKTQPITLTVVAQGNAAAQKQKQVYITSEVSSQDVYVQQLFTLKIKLHLAVDLKRGSLSEPKMTGAEIKQVGPDQESTQIIDGKRIRIIERIYSIKPQNSGIFVLHSTMFEGEIIIGKQRSLFSGLDRGKPISVGSKEIEISVKPVPEKFQGEWLPSEIISIEEQWPEEQLEYALGEPITRKVIITAAGLSSEQLPTLKFEVPQGIKIYPDQAESNTGVQNGLVISQKIQDFAIVPTKPGTFILPELRLPWWNTKLNKLEYAVLPSKALTIKGLISKPSLIAQPSLETSPPVVVQNTSLQWLFLAGWILTGIAWLITAQLRKQTNDKPTPFSRTDKRNYLQLMAACQQNDGEQVLALLPKWAGDLFEGQYFTNLQQVTKCLNDQEFNNQLGILQRSYFSEEKTPWQGKAMLKAISRLQTKTIQTHEVAMALNP